MTTTTGTIEAVTHKFEKFNVLLDDGKWYSTKLEWAPSPAPVKGDVVTFDSGATGKYFSKVRITGSGGGTAPSGSPSAGSVKAPTGRSFPVAALAPERTINRQNALTASVNYAAEGTSPEGIIELARYFESYTTGDLDVEEAKAAMDAMGG